MEFPANGHETEIRPGQIDQIRDTLCCSQSIVRVNELNGAVQETIGIVRDRGTGTAYVTLVALLGLVEIVPGFRVGIG